MFLNEVFKGFRHAFVNAASETMPCRIIVLNKLIPQSKLLSCVVKDLSCFLCRCGDAASMNETEVDGSGDGKCLCVSVCVSSCVGSTWAAYGHAGNVASGY